MIQRTKIANPKSARSIRSLNDSEEIFQKRKMP